ncbi:MAG: TPM domain-containing protein [Deltaproteobacteria bacterium]|nr:TPM domain-containing protein [Deltaproteobacteria bacterium]
MRKNRYRKIRFSPALFALIAVLWVVSAAGAEDYPRPLDNVAVNDFAGVIQPQEQTVMENLAREVWEKTGTAVVVATLETIGDNDPADYANKLYKQWGIGKKEVDKGVLIFLAVKERKIRIEVGYGVEGILPDGLAGEILDKYVLPLLKAGDYSKGMQNAVIAVAAIVAKDAGVSLTGMPTVNHQRITRTDRSGGIVPIILLLIAIGFLLGTRQGRAMLPFILLLLLSGSGRGGGFGGSGGGFGGGFGGFGGGLSGGGGAGRSF